MLTSEHPVIALLEMLERRRGKPWWYVQVGFIVIFSVVMALSIMLGLSYRSCFLMAMAFPMLAGFTLGTGVAVRFLDARMRGQASDDLRSSLVNPSALLDGTTFYCARRTLRDSGPWWVMLALALGPQSWRGIALSFLLLAFSAWLVLQFRYAAVATLQGRGSRWLALPASLLLGLGSMGAMLALVSLDGRHPELLLGGFLVVVLAGLGLRNLALRTLLRGDGFWVRWQGVIMKAVRLTRLPLPLPTHTNAVAARELRRQSWFVAGLPGRLLFLLALFAAGQVYFLAMARLLPGEQSLAISLQLFLIAFGLQGGHGVFLALVSDLRDSARLSALKQTALTAREYVEGVSLAVALPTLAMLAMGIPLVVHLAPVSYPPTWLLSLAVIGFCSALNVLYLTLTADRCAAIRPKGEPWPVSHWALAAGGYALMLSLFPIVMVKPELIPPFALLTLGITLILRYNAERSMQRHLP